VRHEQRGAGPDETMHQPALGIVGRHPVHGREEQWVVGDEEFRPGAEHLVDDGGGGIDGEQHSANRLVAVAAHQPDGVPALGQLGVVPGIERGEHLAQRHGHPPDSR
jgi:hypothetical protein